MIVRRCAVPIALAFASALAATAQEPPPSAIQPDTSWWVDKVVTYPPVPVDSGRTQLVYNIDSTQLVRLFFPPLVRRDGNLIEIFDLERLFQGCPILGCEGIPYPHAADLGVLPAGTYEVHFYSAPLPVASSAQLHSRHTLTVAAGPDPGPGPGPQPALPLLRDGRFEVAVEWENAAGQEGTAQLVQPPSTDSALFYFFDRDNWELMVKVLDGCAINGHFWVFAAASTDVELFATVMDLEGGGTYSFANRLGQPAVATRDIEAFPCGDGLLAAGSGTAPVAPPSAERFLGIYATEFATPMNLPAGATSTLVIDVLSKAWPPSTVHSVTRAGHVITVETLSPETTFPVPQYQYMLPVDIRLSPDVADWFTVELRHLDSIGDSEPAQLYVQPHSLLFFEPHPEYQAVILEAIPAQPTADDEIVLVLDRQPVSLAIEPGVGVVRLSQKAGSPRHPGGWRQPIGKLPAGRHRLQMYTGTSFDDELEIEVAPAPAPPPEPVLAGEFEVAVTWRNAEGEQGEGRLVQAPSRDSALFYFFSPDNWELMVKVLDGCAINGHYWVFGAASTDVGYEVEIRRRGSAQVFRAENAVGQAAPAIAEIAAFPCDPAAPRERSAFALR